MALRSDDDQQIHHERVFREFLASLPADEDGVPVVAADGPVDADELSDGRIRLIDA